MKIRNKYCLLSELTQFQIDKLVELMPVSSYFHFYRGETVIGFAEQGTAGTWYGFKNSTEIVTYKEMLFLLGVKQEEDKLVPHVHQKEIIAWANGEEIEVTVPHASSELFWCTASAPAWKEHLLYRVKPKLTPTQLRIQEVVAELQKLHEQDAVERGINKVMGS
jgi:hypothetical protein